MYLVIGRDNCEFCTRAVEELEENNQPYIYKNISAITLTEEKVWRSFLRTELHATTVPVVFKLIGGYQELSLTMKYSGGVLNDD